MKVQKKTESDILFDMVERVGELERENAMLCSRIDRHDKLFRVLGDLVKLDLALAEMEIAESSAT